MERYAPGAVPRDLNDLIRFLETELNKISSAMNSIADGYFQIANTEPSKREYMVKFADGTNWNPGNGRGLYYYDEVSATWKPLINDTMLANDVWG